MLNMGGSSDLIVSGGSKMAFPEPIPAIEGKDAKEFLERLRKFKLTSAQKEVYRDARANYRKMAPDAKEKD